MSDTIKPALTATEWAASLKNPELSEAFVASGAQIHHLDTGVAIGQRFTADERRHALAALALHGQPFGFRYDDIDFLYKMNDIQATDLANRIAVLLPPR